MRVVYSREFVKQVTILPKKTQEMLDALLQILSKNPFYPTLHTKSLKSELSGMFSFRITRDWRVIFIFDDNDTIRLLKVGNRKDIYRNF
jgi:addiction module RelE/StbE family toxin